MSYDSLRKARNLIKKAGGEIAPLLVSEEELNPEIQEDLSYQAFPLEAATRTYQVDYTYPDDSTFTEFNYFEDGKQRTIQVGFIPARYGQNFILIPVHYFVVAAVILRRTDQKLELWGDPEIREGVLVEKSLVPDQGILSVFEDSGLDIVDTRALGGDYYDLRRRALREAKRQRLEVEENLITRWMQSNESEKSFLVVDGTLMNLRNEDSVERCIGVSKSFHNRYFPVSDHNRILQMKEFERSWAFRFHSVEDDKDDVRLGARERISWYLRLRKRPNSEPEFGLIRVEISQRHAEHASKYADRFSRSLLSERLPTAYPKPRWDKHLYCIQCCENYLSSIMPSISTIRASMKG